MVRFHSHNADFKADVLRDRVVRSDENPTFAQQCACLTSTEANVYRRCTRHEDHGGEHLSDQLAWADAEVVGFFEEG
jgi:hypothetical protein